MYLTRWEERALSGEYGEALRLAMRIIVKVGEALGAERLVEIGHAHVSGVSYDNIGEPGLEFIREFAAKGGRVRVFSTYNPAGISVGVESPFNRDERLVRGQLEVIRALETMGFQHSATCIPYKLRRPRLGEHLAWGESSAVAAANTLYGARTNREAGPVALAAAVAGRTYYWGLHIPENRKPTSIVKLDVSKPLSEPWSGLLGYIIGRQLPGNIPYIEAPLHGERGVISMCAAAAASGNTAMCVVPGFTPEKHGKPSAPFEKLALTWRDLVAEKKELENASVEEAEAFFTGCPHHSHNVAERIKSILEGMGVRRLRRPVWVSVPAVGLSKSVVDELRRRNIHLLPGTCPVVARLRGLVEVLATDSLKTVFYTVRRHKIRVAITSIEEFVRVHGEK